MSIPFLAEPSDAGDASLYEMFTLHGFLKLHYIVMAGIDTTNATEYYSLEQFMESGIWLETMYLW